MSTLLEAFTEPVSALAIRMAAVPLLGGLFPRNPAGPALNIRSAWQSVIFKWVKYLVDLEAARGGTAPGCAAKRRHGAGGSSWVWGAAK